MSGNVLSGQELLPVIDLRQSMGIPIKFAHISCLMCLICTRFNIYTIELSIDLEFALIIQTMKPDRSIFSNRIC